MIRMKNALTVSVIAALMLAPLPAVAGPDKPFAHKGVAADADRYETFLKSAWKTGAKKPAELKLAGDKALIADPRAASRAYAAAVVADIKDSAAWLGLAKALLAIKPDAEKGSERFDLPVNASGAALRAYQTATAPPAQAAALATLGSALQRRSYWRPAIEAFSGSLALADAQDVREAYDKLRAEHGFRMTDYKTENEAANPRVCLQFSESLSRAANADFTKFVAIDGKDPQTLQAEGKQLCLDGLSFGQRYRVLLRAGLPSDMGESLEKPVEIAVYLPDRKAQARFTGRNYVLPSRGQQGIPVVSVNTTAVAIEVYRLGDRSLAGGLQNLDLLKQLSGYEVEQLRERTGTKVYTGELEVASKLNEEVTTAFPVSEAIGTLKPGAYAMIAKPAGRSTGDENHQSATQWFIVSDLGLTALSGSDGIHAFVRSLSDANPVAGAEVKLMARNNEILATARSDARGYIRFEQGLAKGEGGLQPALLVAEKDGTDYAFLDLASAGFDLSDRGVKGRDAAGPLDAFLYTERGVYRPGEEVHVSALVRDKAGLAATLPVTLIVSRPDGVEHKRIALPDGGLGGRTTSLALGAGVMTGTWRARLHTDPKADPIAQIAFLVEDFVPERLDMTLAPDAKSIAPEERATIKATGRYLYGPPAANLALEGDIVVKAATKDLDGFAGYRFGLSDEKINPVRAALESLPPTSADGTAALAVTLPPIPKTSRPLEAEVLVRLRETGGRSIERTLTLPVETRTPRIGIKPLFAPTGVSEGEPASFDVVLLDASGKRAQGNGLTFTLSRIDTNWQWYSRDGNWGYESVSFARKVESGTLDVTTDAAAKITAKTTYGRYRLEIASPKDGTVSSITFNAGWVASAEMADSPEVLETALDKASYRPGDTAKLRIATKHAGKALITVLSNGLLSSQEVEVPKGGIDVALPVGADWGAGAYATTIFYRGMDVAAKRMPTRAIGVKWLAIDRAAETLKVALSADAKVKSASTLKIPVKVAGLTAGEDARVTISAVDAGILNLTRYATPAPEGWFYAQRKLGLEIRDYYGRLIDGMRADRGKLRSGGDGVGGMALASAPPSVETILSEFSGIVSLDRNGEAVVEFQLPEFNGTVRLMAVAWSKDKVGHGQAEVIVRDPVALTVSAPRFLTLGDEADLDVAMHNVEGPAAPYTLVISSPAGDGQVNLLTGAAGREVALAANERKSERVALKPTDVGSRTYTVAVTGPVGPDGQPINVKRQLTFNVLPPAGDIKRTTISQIPAKGSLTLSPDMLADLIPSRTRINLSVGPQARLDVPGLLTALDRYPYGCAEQTVSRALPLVYANNVAAMLGMATDAKIRTRVQGAIDRVFEMQDGSGAFGIWGPGTTDMWLTAYVTDFLTRAKEANYTVNPRAFGQALDKLQNFVAYAKDSEKGAENRAYAMYVLARNSRAPIGELRYYVDTRLDRFASPLAKAQLGAALSMMGDKERAEKTFASAIASLGDKSIPLARLDYGSSLRDHAALVTLASETGVSKAEAAQLVDVIAKAYATRTHTSTQEQAWMVLAANALADEGKSLRLTLDGAPVTGQLQRQFAPADLAKGIVVTNEGSSATDAVITVNGAALTPEPAIQKGFKIERSYFTLDGKKVDLASATGGTASIKQNDRFVAVVTVEAKEAGGRVLLVDRLPAGLEIENPRLVEGGDTKGLAWLKGTTRPEHTEFRDDRFVAAFNFFKAAKPGAAAANEGDADSEGDGAPDGDGEGQTAAPAAPPTTEANGKTPPAPAVTATVAYVVRAVTPGSFVHPAATIEDMYRPERYARSAAGRLTVTAK